MRLAATEEIRKQLAGEGMDYLANDGFVEVDQDAYDHFAAMVHDGYKHLSDAEREALIVVCCFTHPNHRPKSESPEPESAGGASVIAWKEPDCVSKREFRWWMAAIILLLLMLFAARAKAQNGTSQIDVIKFTDSADVNIKTFAGPFTFKCGTGLTCTVSGSKLTVTASGGSPTFDTVGSGTNTTAAMLVGTGASLGTSGSGTINASSLGFFVVAGPATTAKTYTFQNASSNVASIVGATVANTIPKWSDTTGTVWAASSLTDNGTVVSTTEVANFGSGTGTTVAGIGFAADTNLGFVRISSGAMTAIAAGANIQKYNGATGKISLYYGVEGYGGAGAATATAGNGITAIFGSVSTTGQSADIGASNAYATAPVGFYRVSCYVIVTTAATTSSTLPACVIGWTDKDNSTAQTFTLTPTNSGNSLTTFQQASMLVDAKASTNITYATSGYASSGATAMVYAIHVTVERMQ